jgi:polysaccharide biosynthesis transport protein
MFKIHAKRVAIFAFIGLIVGFLVASNLPKLYEARTDILINDASAFQNYDPQIKVLLDGLSGGGIETELGMLQSKGMFENALLQVAQRRHDSDLAKKADDLYRYYEVGAAKGSRVATLATKAPDPELASEIVNQIATFYNEFREDKSRESLATGQTVLAGRVKQAREALRKSELQVQQFKAQHKITDPAVEANQLATYSAALTQQRDAALAENAAVQQQISEQKAKLRVLPNYQKMSVSLTKTPLVSELESRLAKLDADRLAMLETYQPTSAKVRQIEDVIRTTRAELKRVIDGQFTEASQTMQKDPLRMQMESGLAMSEIQSRSLQSKAASAETLLVATTNKIKALPERDMKYAQYLREQSIHSSQYMALAAQEEDLKRRMDSAISSASVLFKAKPENKPVAPDVTKLAIVGTIAGIVLGILFSFLIESLRLPVRTSTQLADLTGLPVSATVPLMPRRRASRMLSSLPDPNTKPAESFRYMAFSQLAREGGAPKLVMFTGIGGGVGCSSAAAQYALATARTGVRTLLVDCDLRHPAITTSFDANEQSGVSDMLNRTLLASDSVDMSLETAHKNLRLVPAGTDGVGGLADFPTSHIVGIINGFAEKADVVVVDAPPCDIVADAARLVPYMDQVCLVVSASSTSFRSVPMAYDILKRCGAKEISLILTHASPQDEPFSKKSRYLLGAER